MTGQAEWCEMCQTNTHLVDDGIGGAACTECGCTNTIRSEAMVYRSTVQGADSHYTLTLEAEQARHYRRMDNEETRWMTQVKKLFHSFSVQIFSHNRSALPLNYVNSRQTPFYERCMSLYGRIRAYELVPGLGRKHLASQHAVRLPYQIAACIMLCVHESNMAIAAREIGEDFFRSGARQWVSDQATRVPIEREVAWKLEQSGNGNISSTWLLTRFQDVALLADIDISDFTLVMREIIFIRDHIRSLATATDDFEAIRGDTRETPTRTYIPLEQSFLQDYTDFTDAQWHQVLVDAHQLCCMIMAHEKELWETNSRMLALAIVAWAMQGVYGYALAQHRSVLEGVALLWGGGAYLVLKTYNLLKQRITVWANDFRACGLSTPLLARPGRANAFGDGLSGYGGDARRAIPDYDIVIAALPTLTRNWRKIAEYRSIDRKEPSYLQALQATRIEFARAANCAVGSMRPLPGGGAISQIRQANGLPRRSALVVPSPNSRATQAVYDFLNEWRTRLPKRRTVRYLMELELSLHEVESGDMQRWIARQKWRWCPVEAWMRTLHKPEHLPLSLLPVDLESLKRDFEHAEILAEERKHDQGGAYTDENWLSERPLTPAPSVGVKRKISDDECQVKRQRLDSCSPEPLLVAAQLPDARPDARIESPEFKVKLSPSPELQLAPPPINSHRQIAPLPPPCQPYKPLQPPKSICGPERPVTRIHIDKAQVGNKYIIALPPLPPQTALPTRHDLNEITTRARVYQLQADYWLDVARHHLPPGNKRILAKEQPRDRNLRDHRLVIAIGHHRDCVAQSRYLSQFAPTGTADILEAFRRAAWWCIDRGFEWEHLAHTAALKLAGVKRVKEELMRGLTPEQALRGTDIPLNNAPRPVYWHLPAYGAVRVPMTHMLAETADAKGARAVEAELRGLLEAKKGRKKGTKETASKCNKDTPPDKALPERAPPVPVGGRVDRPLLLATSVLKG